MELVKYVNGTYEEEAALYDKSSNKVVLKGDYYHDKISHLIEGYLQALEDFKIYTKEVKTVYILPNEKIFNELEFYNDDYEYEEED